MIGIVVDDIVNSPQYYVLFRELNKLSEKHNCYLFTNMVRQLPMKNKFAILQYIDALSHQGILIGTSIINSQVVINSLTPSEKYFYIWYPEWVNLKNVNPMQFHRVFQNNEMDLITRSESHNNLCTKLFKPSKGIVSNWNAEQLEQVLEI